MAQTTFCNTRGIAHKGSGGMSTVFPDVCKTPVGSAVVPIPYPNTKSNPTAKAGLSLACQRLSLIIGGFLPPLNSRVRQRLNQIL